MPREEFKADDGSTVILTDDLLIRHRLDRLTSVAEFTMEDVATSTGYIFQMDGTGTVLDAGTIGQADAKVRLMIELPPDTEDSDGDS